MWTLTNSGDVKQNYSREVSKLAILIQISTIYSKSPPNHGTPGFQKVK